MKNDKEKLTLNENELTDFDFEFVRKDKGEKIHDEKFKTKPTTFAKDALRRFAKNKASVVGAAIIGVLLLGSFLSFLSPYDISEKHAEYARMLPKIRDADNGWWDGTERMTNKIFNEETGVPMTIDADTNEPVDVEARIVVPGSVSLGAIEYYDGDPNLYAKGGYYRITSDTLGGKAIKTQNFETKATTLDDSDKGLSFHVSQADKVSFKVTFGGTDGVTGCKLAPANIYLKGYQTYRPGQNARATENVSILLNDSPIISEDGEDLTVEINDIAERMASVGRDSVYYAKFVFEFPSFEDNYSYILIKEIEASCDEGASDHLKKRLADISFDNANWVAANTSPEKNENHYWRSTGFRKVYRAYAHRCSYLKDQYEEVFGEQAYKIGQREFNTFIKKGWCVFGDWDDPSTFILTEEGRKHCPVTSVVSIHSKPEPGSTISYYDYNCTVIMYRYYGFSSMPKFIFGTDANGHDMLTKSLSCLKNSLLLAIITSAICLAIGLVWGSVSGYFGGNVDLIMERITDILSGVPWIVVMTLVMILLGRTYITFGIAICLTGWIGTASRTRTQFYRFKGREYVLASRTLGASDARLIFRHILPNGLGTIVTGSVLMIPSTIFSEATLSYLGLGLESGDSFGVLLSENQINLQSRPALIIVPSIIISLLMISFNLFGNGLRDALNPTLKGGEQ